MNSSWKKKSDPKTLLDEFESNSAITSEGGIEFTGHSYTRTLVNALVSIVNVETKFPPSIQDRLVKQGLYNARKSDDFSQEKTLSEINKSIKSYGRKKKEKYHLTTTISLSGFSSKLTRKTSRTNFEITHHLPKVREKEYRKFLETNSGQIPGSIPKKYTPLTANTSARGEEEAGYIMLEDINVIRAIWNFLYNTSRSFHYASPPIPFNQILLGPLHAIHDHTGKLIESPYFYEESYTREIKTKRIDKDYTAVKNLELSIRRTLENGKIGAFIKTGLSLYNTALDETRTSDAFLRLWIALEHLTLTDAGNGHETTVNRASFVWNDLEKPKLILNSLRQRRNSAIHDGEQDRLSHDLVYDIKRFVEQMIRFYLWGPKAFGNLNEIREFLDLPASLDGLKRKKMLSELAIKYRNQGGK